MTKTEVSLDDFAKVAAPRPGLADDLSADHLAQIKTFRAAGNRSIRVVAHWLKTLGYEHVTDSRVETMFRRIDP